MNKVANGWELHAILPPGRYEYKFIADGEWLHDPMAAENVRNEHGTLNSVLLITVPIKFTLPGNANAKRVILAGSFNGWNENKEQMVFQNGAWTSTLNLPGGKQTYKFIVDGKWMTDPGNPLTEDDGYGNINSVLFVH
jgi:1,4-alpha-glucan branching enzyme